MARTETNVGELNRQCAMNASELVVLNHEGTKNSKEVVHRQDPHNLRVFVV